MSRGGQIITNVQSPNNQTADLVIQSLGIGAYLVIGIWSLVIQASFQRGDKTAVLRHRADCHANETV